MNVKEIAEKLNEKAMADGYQISRLPQLRKQHLNKKTLPNKIFTNHTIFDDVHRYAFHHGGRDEMQFNFGEEEIDGKKYFRCALCFSLEASQSLPDPVNDLEPFRKRFNQCVEKYPAYLTGFKIWYFKDGTRYGEFNPQRISDAWFQYGNFICIGNIINKSLDQIEEIDLAWILSEFDRLLPIYEFCVLNNGVVSLATKRIFTRLTSNKNNWELPSPHKWKKENQGKKNIPFENQYGFGHEEWLLNQRYNVDGFQYGFIRGIQNLNEKIKHFGEVYLYTVEKDKSKNLVYYLGHIRNVEIITHDPVSQKKIKKIIHQNHLEMLTEVEAINADTSGIVKFPFEALVRFKLDDVHFFDEPVHQPNFDLETYKRFQPYKLEGSIDEIFQVRNQDYSDFVSGKSNQTTVFNRTNKESSVTVEKVHTEIVEALEKYLTPNYSLAKENISIETMRFQGNIADVVTKDSPTEISIYEIKTTSSGRRNIRDAISQLLDYALHTKYEVRKLVIVSPVPLKPSEQEFFARLITNIKLPVQYMCYWKDLVDKFI